MSTDIEQRFEETLHETCRRTLKETGHRPTRFLQMLHEIGGLRTVQELLATERVTEGYIAMWKQKRLDLTIENLILKPEWHALFTDAEREVARERLKKYGYNPD